MKKYKFVSLLASSAVILSACGGENIEAKTGIDIYTSFSPITAIAENIVTDDANITQLVNGNIEPHEYEATARDIANVTDAEIFAYNGLGFEHYIDDMMDSIESDVKFVETSKDVPVVVNTEEGVDSHIWLNFENVEKQAINIANALIEVDSENKETYTNNLNEFINKLTQLNKSYDEVLVDKEGSSVLVLHPAYTYLFEQYGITQVVIQKDHEVEPTIADLKETIDYIKQNDIKYIFASEVEHSKPLNTVVDETGIEVYELHTLENIEEEITKETYFNLMEQNLETIKKAIN